MRHECCSWKGKTGWWKPLRSPGTLSPPVTLTAVSLCAACVALPAFYSLVQKLWYHAVFSTLPHPDGSSPRCLGAVEGTHQALGPCIFSIWLGLP